MGRLEYPISKDELLDAGLAPLIKLMNIPGKLYTTGSCLHDKIIVLQVENEEWFLAEVLPRIFKFNRIIYGFNVTKLYDESRPGKPGLFRQSDKFGNQYYWVVKDRFRTKRSFLRDLIYVFQNLTKSPETNEKTRKKLLHDEVIHQEIGVDGWQEIYADAPSKEDIRKEMAANADNNRDN